MLYYDILFEFGGIWLAGLLYVLWQRRILRHEFIDLTSSGPHRTEETRSPVGISDRPTETDNLGFGSVSGAIANLLRNRETQAPYTIVLSGNWGSGKSSIMAQIRKKLCQDDKRTPFRHIWINVWHFQSGEHLFVNFIVMLLNRCRQFGFYRRLWWQRFQKLPFWNAFQISFGFFVVAPLAVFLVYSLLQAPPLTRAGGFVDDLVNSFPISRNSTAGQLVTAPFRLLTKSPQLIKESIWPDEKQVAENESKPAAQQKKPQAILLATLVAWLTSFWTFRKEIATVASSIANMVPFQGVKIDALKADPGYRITYQKELREILQAAPSNSRFIIFIDDVDRISGGKVLELLETINFISDTASRPDVENARLPKVFFLMAMNVPEVIRTLGHALDPDGIMSGKTSEGLLEREVHAKRYLSKLVDIVVTMPDSRDCTEKQVNTLLTGAPFEAIPKGRLATLLARYIPAFLRN